LDQFGVVGLVEVLQVGQDVTLHLDFALEVQLHFVHDQLLDAGAFRLLSAEHIGTVVVRQSLVQSKFEEFNRVIKSIVSI
jgi:hypothetical protein